MKIALLTHEFPPYPGGVGRYCHEMALAAAQSGHEVLVIAPNHGDTNSAQDAFHEGVTVLRFKGDVFGFKEMFGLSFFLKTRLNPKNFDLIHIADWPMLLAYNLSFPFSSTPITITFHGTDVLTLKGSLKARALLSHKAVRRAAKICANSEYTLKLAERELSFSPNCRKAITHLAAGQFWSTPPSPAGEHEFKEFMLNWPDIKYRLTTVARIDARKGHINAIKAIAQLDPEVKKCTLYIVIGKIVDESLHQHLMQLADSLGVNISFAGRRSDEFIKSCYRNSNIFLLLAEPDPRRIEGFGLVFLEAAGQGLFSIASNVHAIPEVIKQGTTGILVDPHRPELIAQAIKSHLNSSSDPALRQAIQMHSLGFSWEECARRTYS